MDEIQNEFEDLLLSDEDLLELENLSDLFNV